VGAADGGGRLDRSYASLDDLERYVITALDRAQDREVLVRRAELYVAAVLSRTRCRPHVWGERGSGDSGVLWR